eukprot:CAMPEP_0168355228 /NCGR_PEP_ID=MMETSP0213-20121227/24399_1 /TAXON_ID=151035 /ORGANISM="Euplotes harpa, Strain FSP1.4" /LENGTH=94 /DNA_ID=CAMNT_0008367345 /DNA_START=263 /DNA_END=547 /DNA_ORIENTATION=-
MPIAPVMQEMPAKANPSICSETDTPMSSAALFIMRKTPPHARELGAGHALAQDQHPQEAYYYRVYVVDQRAFDRRYKMKGTVVRRHPNSMPQKN